MRSIYHTDLDGKPWLHTIYHRIRSSSHLVIEMASIHKTILECKKPSPKQNWIQQHLCIPSVRQTLHDSTRGAKALQVDSSSSDKRTMCQMIRRREKRQTHKEKRGKGRTISPSPHVVHKGCKKVRANFQEKMQPHCTTQLLPNA